MVDCPEHLDLAAAAVREAGGGPIQVCLDVDAGWWPLGGRIRIGVRRSPVRTPEQAAALARDVLARPELRLDGLMSYEAHIAGVGDRPPGRPLMGRCHPRDAARLGTRAGRPPRRRGGGGERRRAAALRQRRRDGLGRAHRGRAGGDRGRGRLGLYGPTLFDAYTSFSPQPAALFALPVVRRPDGTHGDRARRRLSGLGRGRRRPPAVAVSPGGAAARQAGGRGRGPDAAARAGRRGVAGGRCRVDAACQGGGAV